MFRNLREKNSQATSASRRGGRGGGDDDKKQKTDRRQISVFSYTPVFGPGRYKRAELYIECNTSIVLKPANVITQTMGNAWWVLSESHHLEISGYLENKINHLFCIKHKATKYPITKFN